MRSNLFVPCMLAGCAGGIDTADGDDAELRKSAASSAVVFRPSLGGAAQADHFVAVIEAHGGLADGDLPPVADVEVSDSRSAATVIAELRAFLDRVQARTGGSYLGNPDFSTYSLWVASSGLLAIHRPGLGGRNSRRRRRRRVQWLD
jgi:hypothetical protein